MTTPLTPAEVEKIEERARMYWSFAPVPTSDQLTMIRLCVMIAKQLARIAELEAENDLLTTQCREANRAYEH